MKARRPRHRLRSPGALPAALPLPPLTRDLGPYDPTPACPAETLVHIRRVQTALLRRHGNWFKSRRLRLSCTLWELCGGDTVAFVQHLESQFAVDMTWANFGQWTLDHYFPLAAIDPEEPEQILGVMHFTNLRPAWAQENLVKGKLPPGPLPRRTHILRRHAADRV